MHGRIMSSCAVAVRDLVGASRCNRNEQEGSVPACSGRRFEQSMQRVVSPDRRRFLQGGIAFSVALNRPDVDDRSRLVVQENEVRLIFLLWYQ